MKKLPLQLILLLLILQNSFGQFKKFYMAEGFILSHGASISHIALAGGGVVLKGVAKPVYPDSVSTFINLTFAESNGLSTMIIQTPESDMSFSDSSWIMRDAAMLVKSERSDSMYRDVNLFGQFTLNDYEKGYDERSLYKVEMADSLRKTKSGQTLLYMDIMLASNANTKYYSSNDKVYEDYVASNNSLMEMIQNHEDSLEALRYKSANEIYIQLKNFDSLRLFRQLDRTENTLLYKIEQYSLYNLFKDKLGFEFSYYDDTVSKYETEIDSLFNLDYSNNTSLNSIWDDYTYNDENTDYTFYRSKDDNKLIINGEPHYTFLCHEYLDFGRSEIKVDSLFTNYHIQHPNLIKNLNYTVVTNAEHFGRIAAFYRYLRSEYPKLWNQAYTHYLHIPKTKGETPGFIGNNPGVNNNF